MGSGITQYYQGSETFKLFSTAALVPDDDITSDERGAMMRRRLRLHLPSSDPAQGEDYGRSRTSARPDHHHCRPSPSFLLQRGAIFYLISLHEFAHSIALP